MVNPTSKTVSGLCDEIRNIARDAPMSAGTRTRLHAIAHDIEKTARPVETTDQRVTNLINALNAKQAKIDALMMEFCPGEMSKEQREEWAKHQVPADVELPAETSAPTLEQVTRERDNWEQCAAEFCRNMEYYRGLVDKIGELLGEEAHIQDDGGRCEDILRAKVPELVAARLKQSETSCWQPIATAPESGYILGAWKDGKWHVREMFREHDEWVDTMSDRVLSPTHWAPTPPEKASVRTPSVDKQP